MPDFSIVIPVYNAEKTLHKCLDSLLMQTYDNFEVHMIENGSVDSSDIICREYALKDSRFLLHTCENNCGPSGARNIGLEHAKGHFIAFIDSDDFVQPDYLETLKRGFESADVVFFGYRKVMIDGQKISTHIPNVFEKSGYYEMLMQLNTQDLFGYTWIKAFRADAIGEHRFSENLNLMEDEVFTCEVLTEQRRIAVIPKPIYNYVTGNSDSLMGRTHADYCCKVDTVFKAWNKLLEQYDKRHEAMTHMANSHVSRCMYYCFEHDVNIKNFCNQLADSSFFAVSTLDNSFVQYIKGKKYIKITTMKTIYILKNKIVTLLKR